MKLINNTYLIKTILRQNPSSNMHLFAASLFRRNMPTIRYNATLKYN